MSMTDARSARRAAPSCPAAAGSRRPRCGCCRTTSTPRSPSTPRSSIVYGGTGKAARDWAVVRRDRRARCSDLARRRDAARAVRQAGRRVRDARVGAARADRQLEPRRRLGDVGGVPPARGARPDDVRADDRRLVDLHRQPGDPAGHLRDVRRGRRQALRRHRSPGTITLTGGPRRDGRRAAARGDAWPAASRSASRSTRRGSRAGSSTATSTCEAADLDDALRHAVEARDARRPLSIGLLGNAADVVPQLLAMRGADRRRDRPDVARTTRSPTCRRASRSRTGRSSRASEPDDFTARARESMARHVEAMVGFQDARRRGVRLRQLDPRRGRARRLRARVRVPRLRPGVHPAAVLRGQGAVPLGGALRRPRRHRRDRPRGARPVPGERVAGALDATWPARRCSSRGCRRGSAGSATASAHQAGLRFNELVASGEITAPIVIGRDHLDCGSVASPYRETEAMQDGSDAIADWPLLNAMVNTASGASWVSIHHGGGVGIGRSIHAGQVIGRRRHGARRAEARARPDERSGHGRDPPRRRGLRPGRRGRGRARRARADAGGRVTRVEHAARPPGTVTRYFADHDAGGERRPRTFSSSSTATASRQSGPAPSARPARPTCAASRCPASPTSTRMRSTARCAAGHTGAAAASGPGARTCTPSPRASSRTPTTNSRAQRMPRWPWPGSPAWASSTTCTTTPAAFATATPTRSATRCSRRPPTRASASRCSTPATCPAASASSCAGRNCASATATPRPGRSASRAGRRRPSARRRRDPLGPRRARGAARDRCRLGATSVRCRCTSTCPSSVRRTTPVSPPTAARRLRCSRSTARSGRARARCTRRTCPTATSPCSADRRRRSACARRPSGTSPTASAPRERSPTPARRSRSAATATPSSTRSRRRARSSSTSAWRPSGAATGPPPGCCAREPRTDTRRSAGRRRAGSRPAPSPTS